MRSSSPCAARGSAGIAQLQRQQQRRTCALTFDMSGDRRHAKHAVGRPLDGGVRPQLLRLHANCTAHCSDLGLPLSLHGTHAAHSGATLTRRTGTGDHAATLRTCAVPLFLHAPPRHPRVPKDTSAAVPACCGRPRGTNATRSRAMPRMLVLSAVPTKPCATRARQRCAYCEPSAAALTEGTVRGARHLLRPNVRHERRQRGAASLTSARWRG
jgi:hypothetical protein